jgi:hypothetical protein
VTPGLSFGSQPCNPPCLSREPKAKVTTNEINDLYDYHAHMEVHDDTTTNVHVIQPQINQQ